MENTGGLSMKLLAWAIIVAWLLVPLPCAAEWYKYQDENGVWHYSDALTADVPLEKRKEKQKYKEADDYLSEAQREQKRLQEQQARAKTDDVEAAKMKQQKIKDQYNNVEDYQALEQKRVELVGIYKEMQAQKQKMDSQKDKVDSPEAYQAHRAVVSKYNERAREYQLRREAYEQALRQYEQKNKGLAKKKTEK
jgi:hypothetical protein